MYVLIAILAVVFLLVIPNIHVVQQSRAYVIERLGVFQSVWGVGMHFKLPFVDRIARKVSLKEQVLDYPPQPVITKDNVTMQIDTVVYFQITDPKLYCYGVEQPMMAMETLTATTLRNIIGDLELDQTLTSRDVVNTKMRSILDEATDPWGIKVNRVELKNILPPADIQNSMEKQMKAERDRRQSILQAEGQKKSASILFVCLPEACADVIFVCTVKYRCHNVPAQCLCSHTQVHFQYLSDVHTRRYAQRVQDNIQRCAIRQERHIFFRQNPGNDTLVSVTAGHLIADRNLTLLCNVAAYVSTAK